MFNVSQNGNVTLVHENKTGYKVHAFEARDTASMRRSIGILIESPDGKVSPATYVKRSHLIKSNSCFDFLFDCDGDFDREDVDKVKDVISKNMKVIKVKDLSSRPTPEQVYLELCQYVKTNKGNGLLSVSDGYCNIVTDSFDSVLKELNLGYKRLEVLRHFKLIGILRINGSRAYDWKLSDVKGTPYRVYSFMDPATLQASQATSGASDDAPDIEGGDVA